MPVQQEVRVDYKVNAGPAVGALGRIATAAGKINSNFDKASRLLGGVAAVGGTVAAAFSFERIINSTKEHLELVKRISALTRTDAKTADALVETFANVGLRGQDAERILMGMGRKASMMDMQFQRFGMRVSGTNALFRRLGVNVHQGIETSLLKMSKLYKEGKIGVDQIGMAFGVPQRQALNIIELLEKGPDAIKKMIAEGKKFAVGEETLKNAERMQMATNRAQSALTRMQVMIGSELLPVLAKLMEDAASKIRSWLPEVKKFAVFLRDNLHQVLGIVVKIGKVLLANYALMKISGSGMGTWAARGLAFARGGTGFGGTASRLLSGAVGMGMSPGMAGGMMPMMTSLVRVFSMLGRLTLIGTAAMVAWKAFEAIKNNALGVRDRLLDFWKRLQAHFAVIYKLFAPVAELFSGNGAIGKFFTKVIVVAIDGLVMAVDGLMQLITTIAIWIKNASSSKAGYLQAMLHPVDALADAAIQAAKLHRDEMKKQEAERTARTATELATPEGRRKAPSFDFRNSRFDITQKFEEGFDPDRIALAFSNDLASLGEKKMMSGFSPLYSIR